MTDGTARPSWAMGVVRHGTQGNGVCPCVGGVGPATRVPVVFSGNTIKRCVVGLGRVTWLSREVNQGVISSGEAQRSSAGPNPYYYTPLFRRGFSGYGLVLHCVI